MDFYPRQKFVLAVFVILIVSSLMTLAFYCLFFGKFDQKNNYEIPSESLDTTKDAVHHHHHHHHHLVKQLWQLSIKPNVAIVTAIVGSTVVVLLLCIGIIVFIVHKQVSTPTETIIQPGIPGSNISKPDSADLASEEVVRKDSQPKWLLYIQIIGGCVGGVIVLALLTCGGHKLFTRLTAAKYQKTEVQMDLEQWKEDFVNQLAANNQLALPNTKLYFFDPSSEEYGYVEVHNEDTMLDVQLRLNEKSDCGEPLMLIPYSRNAKFYMLDFDAPTIDVYGLVKWSDFMSSGMFAMLRPSWWSYLKDKPNFSVPKDLQLDKIPKFDNSKPATAD